MNLSRTYAIAFGAVYTLVGLLRFAVSTTLATANLIVFPVNLLHNLVHLLVGVPGSAPTSQVKQLRMRAEWRSCSQS